MTSKLSQDLRLPLVRRRVFLAESTALVLAACGGGGGDGGAAPAATPAPSPAPAPAPAPTPAPAPAPLAVASVSNANPAPLTPFYVRLTGFDPTAPYTVSLTNGSNAAVSLPPLRTQDDGTVVLSTPLHLDSATGQTAALSSTLTITQNGRSASTDIVIADLPSLSSYGLALGAVSRAFYIHQEMAFARSLNAQQALAGYRTGSTAANSALITHLAAQLKSVILARNDVDRIVTDNSVSIPIGSAADGTAFSFGAGSVDVMDRLIAQYLLAFSNDGALVRPPPVALSARARRRALKAGVQPDGLSTGAMQTIVQSLGLLAGSTSFVSMQQTQTDAAAGKATTLDAILSSASTALTLVTVGAGLVACGAAIVPGGAVIAAGAAAVATYGALAGVVVGSVAVGNDLYNVGTNTYDYLVAPPGSAQQAAALGSIERSAATLAADTVTTTLGALGVGNLLAAPGLGTAAVKVFDGIFQPIASDAALAAGGLAAGLANLYAQHALEDDPATASSSVGALNGASDFGMVTGNVDVTNSQGATFAGLTGVSLGNGADPAGQFSTIADPTGDYVIALPLDNSSIDYGALVCSAYDPITDDSLASTTLDLTALANGATVAAPGLAGQCTDDDAGDPDEDDPDCD
jgi:hypothetical protein